jgi:uncharacterized protein
LTQPDPTHFAVSQRPFNDGPLKVSFQKGTPIETEIRSLTENKIYKENWEFGGAPSQLIRVSARSSGPNVLVLGGVHGNEVGGSKAVSSLIQAFETGEAALLNGTLTLIPIVNTIAFKDCVRFKSADLNRGLFRLADTDIAEGEIARALLVELKEADLLFDLHTFTGSGVPFVFLGPDSHTHRGTWELKGNELDYGRRLGMGTLVTGWQQAFSRFLVEQASFLGSDIYTVKESLKIKRMLTEFGGTTEVARSFGGLAMTIECGHHHDELAGNRGLEAVISALRWGGHVEAAKAEVFYNALPVINFEEVIMKRELDHLLVKHFHNFESIKLGQPLVVNSRHEVVASAEFDGVVIFSYPNSTVGSPMLYLGRKIT